MDVIVKWHETCQNLLLKLALQFPLNSFHQRIAARVIYGTGGEGWVEGSTAYSHHHRAGGSHAAGASLASVLKEGKGEIPTREAVAEADSIFFHQLKRPFGSWKRGQETPKRAAWRAAWEENQIAANQNNTSSHVSSSRSSVGRKKKSPSIQLAPKDKGHQSQKEGLLNPIW